MKTKPSRDRTNSMFTRCMVWLIGGGLLSGALGASGAELYVATNATPAAPFSSWATGFDNLQDAFDYASDGDTIHLAGHPFSGGPAAGESYVFCLTNKADLTVIGGYKAEAGSPGERDPEQWPTVLRRDSGDAGVLHLIGVSNVVVRGVTIRDGLVPEAFAKGGGVYLSESLDVMFEDCHIVENINNGTLGGGFCLETSSTTLTNCLVGNNKSIRYGGGIYLDGASRLTLEKSLIDNNEVAGSGSRGGGIYVDGGGVVEMAGSRVRGNRSEGISYSSTGGGGVYVADGAVVEAEGSEISGNETVAVHYSAPGGGFWVDEGAELNVFESVVVSNRASSYHNTSSIGKGGALYGLGTTRLRNVVISANKTEGKSAGGAIWAGDSLSSKTTIENCTIADNIGDVNNIGVYRNGGILGITNTIVWGHEDDLRGFEPDENGVLPTVWYSNTGDGWNVGHQGCHSTDPLFVDRVRYHLLSKAGCYPGGYFSGGAWSNAPVNSPLIDLGDPASGVSREPVPNGARVNMGAYGNTEVASKTDLNITLPAVSNLGAHGRTRSGAILSGMVPDDGGKAPAVTIEYWLSGSGTTNRVGLGIQTNAFELTASGLNSGAQYQFQIRAENSAGTVYSTVESFATVSSGVADWFVSAAGDFRDGTTWATAYHSLSWALQNARPGDTIHLAGETFSEPGTSPGGANRVFLLQEIHDLVIMGGYEARTTLAIEAHPGARDGDLWPTALERGSGSGSVFHLQNVSNVVFRGIAFRNGQVAAEYGKGGGIHLSESQNVLLDDCAVEENVNNGTLGGGLCLEASSATLTHCRVTNNESIRYGGGIYLDGSSRLSLEQVRIDDNQAAGPNARGGGIYVDKGGVVTIKTSRVSGNLAQGASYSQALEGTYYIGSGGGGLCVADGGIVTIENSGIHANEALAIHGCASGGGIKVDAGATLSLRNSTVLTNRASSYHLAVRYGQGGAIHNRGMAHLRNVLMTANRAEGLSAGGAVWTGDSASSRWLMENGTLADNIGDVVNVGVDYVSPGALAMTNTIVWGHAEDLRNWPADGGVLQDVSHAIFGAPVGMHGVNGCLVTDPLFVGNGDYRLQSGRENTSPAIDAGIRFPWMNTATDLDGNRRVLMGNVDIGAYETEGPAGTLFLIR